jgi:SAM-dependent methyltransferase
VSTYVFDAGWQKERDRLRSLESMFDPATTRHLAELGVTDGWRCLEVGCGAGGVALWLARRVGPSGAVLATDLDPRFVESDGQQNLDVREHDILTDPLEDGWFDLAHARAVVEHLPDKKRGLERLAAAVRPGGWLLIEDVHFGGPMAEALAEYAYPPRLAATAARVFGAVAALFAAAGADASFGPRLPGLLKEVGLEEVRAESRAVIVPGPTELWARGTIEQLSKRMMEAGLVAREEVERFLAETADEASHFAPPFMTTAWGRRPSADGRALGH